VTDLPELPKEALEKLFTLPTKCPKANTPKERSRFALSHSELKRRSSARKQTESEFHYVMEDGALRHRLDDNRIYDE